MTANMSMTKFQKRTLVGNIKKKPQSCYNVSDGKAKKVITSTGLIKMGRLLIGFFGGTSTTGCAQKPGPFAHTFGIISCTSIVK